MSRPLLELEGVEVCRGGRAILRIPYLGLGRGEVLALIGPNGAGKTTALLVMALLLRPERGRVLLEGEEPRGQRRLVEARRRMAVVFQEPLLLGTTVQDNVMAGLRLRGVTRREAAERARHWLGRLGVGGLAARRARTLSGGEAQRVSLARALAVEPELLFLDEPFRNLDYPTRVELLVDLQEVLVETGVSAVLVTHDYTELALAGRVLVLEGGRPVQAGSPAEVLERPASESIARLVGMTNIWPGEVTAGSPPHLRLGEVSLPLAGGPLPPPGPVLCCLRPEAVTLQVSPARGAGPALPGMIRRVVAVGPAWRVEVDCGFPLVALVPGRPDPALGPGLAVWAAFPAGALHFLPR